MTKFSIIIPTKDREKTLNACLYYLSIQKFKDFDIIIINDSKKKLNINKYNLSIRIIESNKQKGPGFCRNIGFSILKTDYAVLIDDDCFPLNNWALNIYKKIIIKNILWAKGNVIFDGNLLIKKYLSSQIWGYNSHNEFSSSCNVVLKKVIVERFRFDERFSFAFEDVDLFNQVKNHYSLIYIPDIKVIHHGKTSLFNIFKTYFRYGQGNYIYSLKLNRIVKSEPKITKYIRQLQKYKKELKDLGSMIYYCLLIYFVLIDIIKVLTYKLGYYYAKYS